MAKVKMSKKSTKIDMTAMCDVAFLLLSFFVMTSTAKIPEPLPVDTPASTRETKLPDTDLVTLTVGDGKVFFGMVGQDIRKDALGRISEKYKVTFTEDEAKRFSLIDGFGVPVGNLKQIINISSGAAHKPYYGWTVYCATKAAIDMMTKTIALEQETVPNCLKILAIYPGVVDTQMQAKIRESDKASFPSIDRFLDLKSTNSLANATTVGKQIYDIDHDDAIENGSILRVKE